MVIEPESGRWYQPAGFTDWFRVLDVDDRGYVTIEYFDGYEELVDMQGWHDLRPEIVRAVLVQSSQIAAASDSPERKDAPECALRLSADHQDR
jgi:hypothetical protein